MQTDNSNDKTKNQPGRWVLPLGIALTCIWLVVLVALTSTSKSCPPTEEATQFRFWNCLEPNAIGDYLAGAFAPLAFIWLVVTVLLQSFELRAQRDEMMRQVKATRSQNSVTHLNFFRAEWNSEPILRARLAVVEGFDQSNLDLTPPDDILASFFEDVADIALSDQVNLQHIWSYFSFYFEGYWPILKPKIYQYRKEMGDKNYYRSFEDLYYKLNKETGNRDSTVMPKSYVPSFLKDEEELARFYLRK